MKIITHESCLHYSQNGHPERPERIRSTLKKLKSQKELPLHWGEPIDVEDASILRAHTPHHLSQLSKGIDFDPDTPAYPNIADHARRSVGGALAALQNTIQGEHSFSLMRPPGHHAERERAMGFCYFNQIAIASLEAQVKGFKKIAVFDFDVHHGNGTEDILLGHSGCAFFSIHQHPCYPGTGTRSIDNCHNYPVPPNTPREKYQSTFSRTFQDLKSWQPDIVAVSAGFDAYARDPLSEETLEIEDFHWLGQCIRNLSIPSLSVLEGGYSNDLPELIFAYLKGLEGL